MIPHKIMSGSNVRFNTIICSYVLFYFVPIFYVLCHGSSITTVTENLDGPTTTASTTTAPNDVDRYDGNENEEGYR